MGRYREMKWCFIRTSVQTVLLKILVTGPKEHSACVCRMSILAPGRAIRAGDCRMVIFL
jgi:hypothetical protein